MKRLSNKSRFALAALLIGVAAVWSGHRAEQDAMRSVVKPAGTVRTMLKRLTTSREARAGLERLQERMELLGHGWPSGADTDDLWRIVRAFSVAEIKLALETLSQGGSGMLGVAVKDMLYYRWAQLDPLEAVNSLPREGQEIPWRSLQSVMMAWTARDPDAAMAWAMDGDAQGAKQMALHMAAMSWANDDPASAFKKAEAYPEAKRHVILHLGYSAGRSEEERRKVIGLLAGGDLTEAEWTMAVDRFSRFGGNDSAAMENLVELLSEQGVPEAAVKHAADRASSMREMRWDPASFRERLSSSEATEEQKSATYRQWSMHQPEQAVAWAVEAGDSGRLAEGASTQAESLLQSGWSPGQTDHSPRSRGLLKQFEGWSRLEPQAAAAWLDTMPGDLRKWISTGKGGADER